MTTTSETYYDPYDFQIDADPYPVWRRLREEMPVYYNEKYDFYALSWFEDVEMPPGSIIFEDPVGHDLHRGLRSRVFTPRRMAAIEPEVRAFCARSLDPLVGTGGFDLISDLGAQVPMLTIGMLLGIPEEDQEALRDQIDEGLRLDEGEMPDVDIAERSHSEVFADYIQYRLDHPSDDVMTELLNAEYEDLDGVTRRLTTEEALNYVNLRASASVSVRPWRGWRGVSHSTRS